MQFFDTFLTCYGWEGIALAGAVLAMFGVQLYYYIFVYGRIPGYKNNRRPAVLGDVLTVTSQVQQLNGKSGVLSQVVTLDPEGQVVADALITFVCIDLKTQKALPLEGELREKLELMIV